MKASEIFDQIGNKLAEHYQDSGFKYTKKWGVKKSTDEYEYRISFNSAEGNKKGQVSLFVTFIISCKSVKNEWNNPVGLISISLWDLGYRYNIGASHSIEESYKDICRHADILLIPFIDIFENQATAKMDEWIEQGFLGKIPSDLYQYPHLDYTTHKHYWIGSQFSAEHNEFGFTVSLRYILDKSGKYNAEKCLNNYYQSLNEKAKKYFLQAFQAQKTSSTQPWNCDYENLPDVDMIKYSVLQGLELNE